LKKLISLAPLFVVALMASSASAALRTVSGYVRYENYRAANNASFLSTPGARNQPVTVSVVGGATISPGGLSTDSTGYFSFVADVPASGTLRLQIAGGNSAGVFSPAYAGWTKDVAIPAGTGVVDMSKTVTKSEGGVRANILNVLSVARSYAAARRDDVDEIPLVNVVYPSSNSQTVYQTATQTIQIKNVGDPSCGVLECQCSFYGVSTCEWDHGWEDVTVGHEYGHHLQYTISGQPMPMVQSPDVCVPQNLNQAWHEGFPTYFGAVLVGDVGAFFNTAQVHMEWPLYCAGVPATFTPTTTSIEAVWSALWDLYDAGGDDSLHSPGPSGELIFKIFDKDLDPVATPTIHTFHDAFVARNPYPDGHRDLDDVWAGNRVLAHGTPHAWADYTVQSIGVSPSNIYRGTTVTLTVQLGNISWFGYDWTTLVPAEVRLDGNLVSTFSVSAGTGTWIGAPSFTIPSNASFGSHTISVRLPSSASAAFEESNTANNVLNRTITVKTICGDGLCSSGETCVSCPSDCGECEEDPWEPPPCFVAGTPITMADGSTKPIEQVRVGEEVLSWDEKSGALVAGAVEQTMVHPDSDRLVVVNDHLVTTAEHPFWVDGRWVEAAQLAVGDDLLRAEVGHASPLLVDAMVTSLEARGGRATTYNFTVSRFHDYFAGGVLVHNKPPVDDP
jgi:hypothetical protein